MLIYLFAMRMTVGMSLRNLFQANYNDVGFPYQDRQMKIAS